ncbi:anthocyanidin 3-O-glucosyltransferase 6-like [Populus alba]|uniref:anthocyanidin 3-O-glucosyltransferase 6-like n=1 Tax=Populus alba TaxID=43335 RepID=UPI00158BD2FE|nr:anthocyanidin 3-O-glucosyltransferase 6-like [Populus alba]
MKKAEVVLIPIPAMGHIVALVEVAKLLVERDDRLSTTIFIMHPVLDPSTTKYTESLAASTLPDRMRVVNLPNLESKTEDTKDRNWLTSMIESQKPHVEEYVSKMRTQSQLSPDSPQLAGFIFDTFVTGMKDVANGFGVPWYVFSASGAAFICSMFYLQALQDDEGVNLTEFKNSDALLEVPGLANPLPAKLLPSMVFREDMLTIFLEHARTLKETRSILVNTFLEFESYAVHSLSNGKNAPVYPVGPMVKHVGDARDLRSDESNKYRDIMEWLDDQPPLSVMFLCFGSWGSFCGKQVKEIACALEHCGHRFLWSLRKPSSQKGKIESPSDYLNFQEILPEGFLDRTLEIGKVIGWAPQVDILAHPAVGGFASHCGWNSILESVRFGVPVATWPLYAEQQFNAFQMVIDLGLAVEIKMDYRRDFLGDNEIIVSSDDIVKAIKHVMEEDGEVRKKVKEMSRISEKSLKDGGSSFSSLGRLIEDMIDNIS